MQDLPSRLDELARLIRSEPEHDGHWPGPHHNWKQGYIAALNPQVAGALIECAKELQRIGDTEPMQHSDFSGALGALDALAKAMGEQ